MKWESSSKPLWTPEYKRTERTQVTMTHVMYNLRGRPLLELRSRGYIKLKRLNLRQRVTFLISGDIIDVFAFSPISHVKWWAFKGEKRRVNKLKVQRAISLLKSVYLLGIQLFVPTISIKARQLSKLRCEKQTRINVTIEGARLRNEKIKRNEDDNLARKKIYYYCLNAMLLRARTHFSLPQIHHRW